MDRLAILEADATLLRRSSALFFFKLCVWSALLLGGGYLAMFVPGWSKALGFVLLALGIAHGVELQHQALHHTGFRSVALNRGVGFLLGLPILISFSHYRDRHLHHHKHVGTDDDSEFFQYSKENNDNRLALIANLLMLPHWRRVGGLCIAAWSGRDIGRVYRPSNERPIRMEYRLFALYACAVLAGAILVGGVFWLFVIGPLLAAPVHTLIELPEHLGCDKSESIFQNTRTIRSNRFMTWLMNGNNYHVEHHLLPAVIPERLHLLHAHIHGEITFLNESYLEFILERIGRREVVNV